MVLLVARPAPKEQPHKPEFMEKLMAFHDQIRAMLVDVFENHMDIMTVTKVSAAHEIARITPTGGGRAHAAVWSPSWSRCTPSPIGC